jgi:hypothetical protein
MTGSTSSALTTGATGADTSTLPATTAAFDDSDTGDDRAGVGGRLPNTSSASGK